MAYTPFKMKGPSLYASPAKNPDGKKYLTSDNKVTTDKITKKYEKNKDGSVSQIVSDNENQKSYLNEFDKDKTSKDGKTTSYAQRGNKGNRMTLTTLDEEKKS
jgi:hypothetical protein